MKRSEEIDIITDSKLRRLGWIGRLQRMNDDRIVKKVFISKSGGSRPRGKARHDWIDGVEQDLKKLRIKNWKCKAQNRME